MNYDNIILECNTTCEKCPTYMECQYQTTVGAEKQAWLEKLIERDKAQAEAQAEEQVEAPFEAQAEERVEAPCEVQAEAYHTVKHETTCVATLTSEQIHAVYLAVFGENFDKKVKVEEPIAEPAVEAVAEPAVEEAASPQAPQEKEAETVEAVAEETEEAEDALDAAEDAQEALEAAAEEQKAEKQAFKLTPPPQNEQLMQDMCTKRARKLIYRPNEVVYSASFKVLGTDKKNDVGEKVKDIIDAEIKQGLKLGYLDKFDGLKSSEIKEEYEDDIVYEFADQEFKKTGVIYDGASIKVYLYDWDVKACHHVGHVDLSEANELIPYLTDKEKYSFDVCGIITGGKAKRVVKEGSALKIIKEKGDPIGLDVDIAVIPRKD